jgi:N-acetyl sugar amidotransferase
VPGSGGKDSFYAAHILKYKYGMHPLTITWAPHLYTNWGFKNFQSWIHAGFDNILFTPSGKIHRLLTRLATENLFHPFQPFIIGQKSFSPKMALLHKISLIFYGEHEAEYGNPIADSSSAKQDWAYFTAADKAKVFLGGVSLKDLKEKFGVEDYELSAYLPANPGDIEKRKVEVHYLGYYLKWHPQACYYYACEHGGFQASPERTPGTYSKYNSIDDKIDDFHYWTTYIKFGIGRATADAAQEVRSADIDRDEAVALVKRFDGEFPERFAEEIFKYLTIAPKEFPKASKMFKRPVMTREYFMELADQFRSPHLWQKSGGEWNLKHAVWHIH